METDGCRLRDVPRLPVVREDLRVVQTVRSVEPSVRCGGELSRPRAAQLLEGTAARTVMKRRRGGLFCFVRGLCILERCVGRSLKAL